MREVLNGLTRPSREDSTSVSETSVSGIVLSPNSEDTESDVFESQVIDPLRYPEKNDSLKSTSSTLFALYSEPSNYQTKVICQMNETPLDILQQEAHLPQDIAYEPETVDFPSSPTFHTPETHREGVILADSDIENFTPVVSTTKDLTRKVDRPNSLDVTQKKRLTVTEELLTVSVDDDQQSLTSLSYQNTEDDDAEMISHEEFTDMLTPDDIDTPDVLEESIMERLGPTPQHNFVNAMSDEQKEEEESTWRSVVISGIQKRIDMTVIEPYKKVLSHGGYMPGDGMEAIIVFSACFLPDRSRKDYDYVMDHLFMYVLTTLDQLVADDYILVYLHGATTRSNMPSFSWIKRCYQLIDRRLRKNLQGLYLVHPSFWLKTVTMMVRPFISSKFTRKLRFIGSLNELQTTIPLDHSSIPSRVKQYDDIRESLLKDKQR